MEVYLDNSATTPAYPEVAKLVAEIMCTDFGNPSSMHMKGVDAEKRIKDAKDIIAKSLKCDAKDILFTSGGTESDNMALIGVAEANSRRGKHIITTMIEHHAILETTEHLKDMGYEVTYLPVDEKGVIRLSDLEAAIRPDTILVSIMHTNNEIGSVMPIAEAGELIKRINPNIIFHTDAVQGYGKAKIYPKKSHIDLLSVSAHKIHGPKGVGFLYIGDKVKINPIIFGGGQQKGMRSGTENVPGIAGMALAANMCYKTLDADMDRLYTLKEFFISEATKIEGITVNAPQGRESAPHIISLSISGVRAEVMLHALEDRGIYVSSGSACATNRPALSSTLQAIGLDKNLLDSTLRFSMSVHTTKEELEYTLKCMGEIIPMLRKYTRK